MKKLPILTKESFEDFVKDHVQLIKSDEYHFTGLQKPQCSEEFKDFTKNIYGVELDVDCFVYPLGAFSNYKYAANYKIKQEEGEYSKQGLMPLWNKKFGQYDGLKVLLDWCFGDLFCGGVAYSHYGQTEVPTLADYNRIKNWGNQQGNYLKAAIEQHQSVVEIFGHDPFLAHPLPITERE